MISYLIFPKWIMSTIHLQREYHLPRETGGFLIGERRGPHIEVTGITQQGSGDVGTHNTFDRSCASHREAIHRAWRDSGGMRSLVGDWHSHPTGTANASSMDFAAWRTLTRVSKRPMIGVIDAGALPQVYFAAEGNKPFAVLLKVEEERQDYYALVLPPLRSRPTLTRLFFSRG
jgi:integrative and conjugative element protein (TIGR02256 family)